jgi:2-oxoisovalerate dehydrogenase E1 component subunit beta
MALDVCHTAREGTDITLVAWGPMMQTTLAAAADLAEQGVSAEVLDVATLKPLDMESILASVARTGRCVIASEEARTASFAGEIAANLAEDGLLTLLAPVHRVTANDVVVPFSRLEHQYMPGKERIVAAAKRVLEFS